MSREGRGRLSSIDLLPDEAEPDIVWALEQLRERKLQQNTILMEFNERLLDKGIDPISKSAWNRYAVRKAIQFRRMDEAQAIAGELTESLRTEAPDEVTVLVAEMIKIAAFERLEEGETTTKGLMELSRALSSAVNAQKSSAEYRKTLQQEVDAKLAQAAEAVKEIGAQKGISNEAIEEINRRLMGGA